MANSGKKAEYEVAIEQLFKPILKACGVLGEQLFIVPGNHDLNRELLELAPSELLKPLKSDSDVKYWLTDDRKRARLLEPFEAFTHFVTEYTKQEQPDYSNIRILEIKDKKIALLGLNSAWMCGRKDSKGNESDKGNVLVGEPQVYNHLTTISDADIKIAVLHHPFKWLSDFDCDQVEGRLMQKCDFILHGHQHNPKVKVICETSGESVVIPAGACYNRRYSDNPLFANAYNFVHLDFDNGNCIVFLRRWSEKQRAWIADTDTYPRGYFDFTLPKLAANKLKI